MPRRPRALVESREPAGPRVRCVARRAAASIATARGLPYRQHKLAFVRCAAATVDDLWKDTTARSATRSERRRRKVWSSGGRPTSWSTTSTRSSRATCATWARRSIHKRLFAEDARRSLSPNARVFVVRLDQRPRGRGVAIRFRRSDEVPWASSLREFRQLCPNMLLYWAMLERRSPTGLTTFDFGRSSPGGGTYSSKLQWGASRVAAVLGVPASCRRRASRSRSDEPDGSRSAVAVWKRCPLWFANMVGPHVVRSIPLEMRGARDGHPRHLGLLPRQRRRSGRRRRDRRGGAGRAVHAEEARSRLSRRTPIDYCLREAGLSPSDLDYVVFYEKPLRKFERLLETYLGVRARRASSSFAMAMPVWLKREAHHARRSSGRASADGLRAPLVFTDHHESHAASAFFPSPFDEAAILTLDGVGEWSTTALGVGRGNRITLTRAAAVPAFARACCTRRSPTTAASR